MKVNIYDTKTDNKFILKKIGVAEIRSNYLIINKLPHLIKRFEKKIHFDKYKNVYFIETHMCNYFINIDFFEEQRFLWLQNSNWFQKEENIRYLVNILFLIIGSTLGILNFLK